MSLRFPYKLQSMKKPIVSLGGRWVRPRPLVVISLVGPAGTYVELAQLDTGADDSVFPDSAAHLAGIDLSGAPADQASAPGSSPVPLRYAQVTLRLTSGNERREWPAWVGFTPATLSRPLLGFAGFLQFFTAIFEGDREEVELSVNSLYPGS